jgi:hypothetical protein
MLEACNRHFLVVQALVNKTICVTTSDFAFYSRKCENFKIFLLNYYDKTFKRAYVFRILFRVFNAEMSKLMLISAHSANFNHL